MFRTYNRRSILKSQSGNLPDKFLHYMCVLEQIFALSQALRIYLCIILQPFYQHGIVVSKPFSGDNYLTLFHLPFVEVLVRLTPL